MTMKIKYTNKMENEFILHNSEIQIKNEKLR